MESPNKIPRPIPQRRRNILPLLGERAGVREYVNTTNQNPPTDHVDERKFIQLKLPLLLLILATLVPSCSKRDNVTALWDDHPEMVVAISNAQATLPQFWHVYDTRPAGESNFMLRIKITEHDRTEHFHVNTFERHDNRIMVTISNAPKIVTTVKLGDRVEIPAADISDWGYTRDKKIFGMYTFKAQIKHMNLSPAEIDAIRKTMAEP